jgi:hypothetical protein
MATDPGALKPRYLAAFLSLLLPGLGQAVKRDAAKAIGILAMTGLLLLGIWRLGGLAGPGGSWFLAILLLPLWWTFQGYDALLPSKVEDGGLRGLRDTLRRVKERALDIRYLGLLFLITAFTDLYIIVANPSYSLTVFCAKPAGLAGILVKAQSPTLHAFIGYGFLRLRRWALLLYLAYAAFGLINATANFACLGYGRIRMVFLLTLLAFTAYVLWRRDCFHRA